MDTIQQLIDELHKDGSDRCWIVEQLSSYNDGRIFSAFIELLNHPVEEDALRIEVLNALSLSQVPEPYHSQLGIIIRNNLLSDSDDLVRQYAARTLRSFIDVKGVLAALESVVMNKSEDIDVRHNALTAFEKNHSMPTCMRVLLQLADDQELGESVREVLQTIKENYG